MSLSIRLQPWLPSSRLRPPPPLPRRGRPRHLRDIRRRSTLPPPPPPPRRPGTRSDPRRPPWPQLRLICLIWLGHCSGGGQAHVVSHPRQLETEEAAVASSHVRSLVFATVAATATATMEGEAGLSGGGSDNRGARPVKRPFSAPTWPLNMGEDANRLESKSHLFTCSLK